MFKSVNLLLALVFISTGAVSGPRLGPVIPRKVDFNGEWLRADGTYRFEIEVGEESLTARYFNPEPVNVESAEFIDFNGQPQIVIVLRDQGYDGSTYRLTYYPEHDLLGGTYARPGAQPAQVDFTRVVK